MFGSWLTSQFTDEAYAVRAAYYLHRVGVLEGSCAGPGAELGWSFLVPSNSGYSAVLPPAVLFNWLWYNIVNIGSLICLKAYLTTGTECMCRDGAEFSFPRFIQEKDCIMSTITLCVWQKAAHSSLSILIPPLQVTLMEGICSYLGNCYSQHGQSRQLLAIINYVNDAKGWAGKGTLNESGQSCTSLWQLWLSICPAAASPLKLSWAPSLSSDWNRKLKFIPMSLALHCWNYFQDSSTSQVTCGDCEALCSPPFPPLSVCLGGWFGPYSWLPRAGSHQQWSIKIYLDNLRPTDLEFETNYFPIPHFKKYFESFLTLSSSIFRLYYRLLNKPW